MIENLPSVKPATKVALFPPLRLKIIFFVSRKVEIFYFKRFDSMEIENESKMVVVYARRRVGYAGNFFLNFSHFEKKGDLSLKEFAERIRERKKEIRERGGNISQRTTGNVNTITCYIERSWIVDSDQ